jgi:drug/metabolite transporter (DMT)-like permease
MIYLLLAVTASSLILISFKVFDRLGVDSLTAITINYLAGAFFGFNSIGWRADYHGIVSANWFPMSVLTGLILISGFILFSLSTRKAGITVTALSSRMAVIISVLSGIILFDDKAGVVKLAGICLALIAFYLTFRKDRFEKPHFSVLLLPLAVFLFMGLNDVILKVTQFYYTGSENESEQVRYVSTAFTFGFLTGIPVLFFRTLRKRQPIHLKSILSGVFLGILNWFSAYYLLMGLGVMEVSVFVPLVNVSVVGISALAGYFLFREKLSPANWLGIALALIAIVMIARG